MRDSRRRHHGWPALIVVMMTAVGCAAGPVATRPPAASSPAVAATAVVARPSVIVTVPALPLRPDPSPVETAPPTSSPAGESTPPPTPAPATPTPPSVTPTTSIELPATSAPPAPAPVLPPLANEITHTVGSGPQVFLTFDDGPSKQTPAVLDVLAAAGVGATFCVLGQQAKAYPDLMARIVAAGHSLCNHSWSHPKLVEQLSAEAFEAEFGRTQDLLEQYGPVAWFRAPEGRWGAAEGTLRQAVTARGVGLLGWDVDTLDWRRPGVEQIVRQAVDAARPGSVILLHDAGGRDRDQTIAALPQIIAGLQAKGLTVAALPAG